VSFAIGAPAAVALPNAHAQASQAAHPANSGSSSSGPAATALLLQSHHGAVDVTGRQFEYDYKTDTFVVTGDAVVNQAATSGGCAH
jgi:lipopolysaccharide export system protein LptA